MNKIFRKPIFLILTVMFLLALTACGSKGEQTSTGSSSESTEKVTINIAYGNQPGEPLDLQAKKWKELAEEKSNGKLELKLYPSSQLGSEKDVVEQAIMGNNVIILTGYDFLMDYVPDVGIFTSPYLTDNFDDLLYLTTTDLFK